MVCRRVAAEQNIASQNVNELVQGLTIIPVHVQLM